MSQNTEKDAAASNLKRFVIPHPGTGEWIKDLTFNEAMEKWFEGFNVPRMIMDDGEPEGFSVSCERVRDYFGRGAV